MMPTAGSINDGSVASITRQHFAARQFKMNTLKLSRPLRTSLDAVICV
jgi:hypothetical protein